MITKPTLILDEAKCRKNIETMFLKAQKNNVIFRPHFKTHQSLEIGRWYREFGVDKITVSSLNMAKYFSAEWNDITVAFPVNILEIETINELAENIQLNLLVESVETITFLKQYLKYEVGFFIKIDVGYNRTGIDPSRIDYIDKILNISNDSNLLNFKGFLGHAGHTYDCRTDEEILAIHNESISCLVSLKEIYLKTYPNLNLSAGDTPTCSIADDFSGVDEIRPGNFATFDLTQNLIGSCKIEQIAIAMACPVVAIHRERNEIVVYGGGVHFSKDRLLDEKLGVIFGRVVEGSENGWGNVISDMYIKSLSQEHGIISVPESIIANYKVGDYLMILPIHSCLTGNLMKEYQTTTLKIISKL